MTPDVNPALWLIVKSPIFQPETTFYWKNVFGPMQSRIAIWSQSLQ